MKKKNLILIDQSGGKNKTDRQPNVGGDRSMEELAALWVGLEAPLIYLWEAYLCLSGLFFSVGLWVDVVSLLQRKSLQLRVDLWGRTTADTTEV